jgi:hypothetical protein
LLPLVWPFARWGVDIVGQLPTSLRNYKYAIVVVEYFSKWIEARVRTMCSLRTGGWSLPGVMSD